MPVEDGHGSSGSAMRRKPRCTGIFVVGVSAPHIEERTAGILNALELEQGRSSYCLAIRQQAGSSIGRGEGGEGPGTEWRAIMDRKKKAIPRNFLVCCIFVDALKTMCVLEVLAGVLGSWFLLFSHAEAAYMHNREINSIP
jgi:hypothetical protein